MPFEPKLVRSFETDCPGFPRTFTAEDGRTLQALIVVSSPNRTQLNVDLTPEMRQMIGTNLDQARSLADHFAQIVRQAILGNYIDNSRK